MPGAHVSRLLDHEARSILARLELVRPYSEHNPMVPAAAVDAPALRCIEEGLSQRRWQLRRKGARYVTWLRSDEGRAASAADAQRKLARVRLLFNGLLSEFDIFSDVLTQRAEHHVGQMLGGIDFAAADMMHDKRHPFDPPHVVTYLDRGHGAAIRRALTRLPSGGTNPVAVVRVPRERVGSTGLAGSVAHEVGHQAAALLGLVPALRDTLLNSAQSLPPSHKLAMEHYARWSSEILADYWAVGRVGVAHTLGLFALLTLPTPHVFLGGIERVHPIPWIRVHISAAIGNALWPHPQWCALRDRWSQLYPLGNATKKKKKLLQSLLTALPTFVRLLLSLRAPRLGENTLEQLMTGPAMAPERLLARYAQFEGDFNALRRARPANVFAVLGQARASGRINAETEAAVLDALLLDWAVRRQRPEAWASTAPTLELKNPMQPQQ